MNRIKEIQDYYNINAKEMADKLCINDQYIYDLQNGKKKINEDFMAKLFNHLNININWFLSGEGTVERCDPSIKELCTKINNLPKKIQELYKKRLEIDFEEEVLKKEA